MYITNNPYELYHHQRLGAKWGQRNGPPYPLSRQQLSLGGYIKKRKEKKTAEKSAKQKAENLRKAREAAAAKRKHEADKERVLQSGSATELLKYKGELTNKEYEQACKRIEWENKISDYSAKELKSKMNELDKIMNNVKTINNWTSIATDSYNLMASIYNATPEGKKNPWELVKKPQGGGK